MVEGEELSCEKNRRDWTAVNVKRGVGDWRRGVGGLGGTQLFGMNARRYKRFLTAVVTVTGKS